MNIFLRADASLAMGTGHLMRCLTLANGLRSHGAHTTFVCRHIPQNLQDALQVQGHACIKLPAHADSTSHALAHGAWLGVEQSVDAQDTLAAIGTQPCDWLIVDHYALDANWERALRRSASKILAIDDLADRQHDCDLLLDQNLYADAHSRYIGKLPASCQQLLGPGYALLRPEFVQARGTLRPRDGVVRRILLFLGGMDAANMTGQAMAELAQLGRPDIAVDVVIGTNHPARDAIAAECRSLGWICHVQTQDMAGLVAAADLAIGAGGSATWERCCLGLPCITMAVAANQKKLVQDGAAAGILLTASPSLRDRLVQCLAQPPLLQSLGQRGMDLVHGGGAELIRRAMGLSGLTVRRATDADSETLFRWRNHENIRAVSRTQATLEWAGHQAWFAGVLADPQRILLIGEFQGRGIGVVRFECSESAAEISIYLNPEEPLQGWGGELMQAAERYLQTGHPGIHTLCAEVLMHNRVSQRFFERNGYQDCSGDKAQSPIKTYQKSVKL